MVRNVETCDGTQNTIVYNNSSCYVKTDFPVARALDATRRGRYGNARAPGRKGKNRTHTTRSAHRPLCSGAMTKHRRRRASCIIIKRDLLFGGVIQRTVLNVKCVRRETIARARRLAGCDFRIITETYHTERHHEITLGVVRGTFAHKGVVYTRQSRNAFKGVRPVFSRADKTGPGWSRDRGRKRKSVIIST